jgi:hypothetical protein
LPWRERERGGSEPGFRALARPALPVSELEPDGGLDPRFVHATALDLRLASDSPARAHGADAWSGK